MKGGVHKERTQGGLGRLTEGKIKRENKCKIVKMKEVKQMRKRTMRGLGTVIKEITRCDTGRDS
jgi:hypothetical protein